MPMFWEQGQADGRGWRFPPRASPVVSQPPSLPISVRSGRRQPRTYETHPLPFSTPPASDLSLKRLQHYYLVRRLAFPGYVLFTNYHRLCRLTFCDWALEQIGADNHLSPRVSVPRRLPR